MVIIKKLILMMLSISLVIMTIGCSRNVEETHVEEVDLSQELKIVEAFGLVKAQDTKNVIIDFPATVKEVLVKEGQQISLGDAIMTLDLSEYVSKISDTENQISIAKLEQQKIQKNIHSLFTENREAEIQKLVNDLSFAKETHQQSMDKLNSYRKLHEAGAISQQEYDEIKRNVEEKKKIIDDINYQLQEANDRKEREIQQLLVKKGVENHQLQIQREKILQTENEFTFMQEKLNKSYIKENQIICDSEKAVIYDIQYAAGDIIDPTSKAFSIANLNSLVIEANVVEDFIGDLQIGASVRILPVADRGRNYQGKVIYISNMAFEKNRETVIPVRISIDNVDDFLLPNYNVDVFIESN